MSLKSVLKWGAIAGATYLGATALSNEYLDTNFKTIGNWGDGSWTGGDTAGSLDYVTPTVSKISTDGNLGAALSAATSTAQAASAAPAANGGSSVLGSLGNGLLNFAKSSGGGTLLAGALQGLAAGKASEAQINEERRYKRAFTPEEMAQINGTTSTSGAPGSNVGGFSTGGYLDRARHVSDFLNGRRQPAISGPVNPSTVAGYARGG